MSPAQSQIVADRYRLVEPLGQGGMGRVWMARDELLHRDVAIKELIPPSGLTEDERQEMRERTLREARAIARFNHPNVVRIFDILRTNGDPWIVMEYVASRSLQDVIGQDGPLSVERTADIGMGMLAALRAAHRAGVVHRDVKPGNVLLGNDGRVVLTDFGLATVPGDPVVTRTGLVLGSPAYIAPERAHDGTAGPEADLWSLGATLYAAVEGQSPYSRPSAIATLAALATEPPAPARRAGPLKPVLNGLLRKDPVQRIDAEAAERLLRRAVGRKQRTSLSMLPGVRRTVGDRTTALPAVEPRLPAARTPAPTEPPATTDGAPTTMLGGAPAAARGLVVDRSAAPESAGTTVIGDAPAGPPAPAPRTGGADKGKRPAGKGGKKGRKSGNRKPPPAGPPAPPPEPPAPPPSFGARLGRRVAVGGELVVLAGRAAATAVRRRPVAAVAVVVVVAVLAVAAVLLLRPDSGPGARPGAPGTPQATATGGPSGGPTGTPGASTAPPATALPVPAGWTTYRGRGYSLAIPAGMSRQSEGEVTLLRETGGAYRFVRIQELDSRVTDPVAYWQREIPRQRAQYGGYRELGVRRVDFRSGAADWEFTYEDNGRNHVIHRVFTTGGRSYTLMWLAADRLWPQNRTGLDIMAGSFRAN
ncbi:hypothetical protein GCM10010123_23690 [Pilimelia anulata]|uniref:non-specific serine/threonine protein kinase n=1 Tax=Pilimelia anulata TaxID=53371 RepID=A0A8J3BAH5_9ACTN|nr:serine/threonine-protein kinase [Pilimelia anulata]GGJ93096.1 hypothetical protein GCM10010123_23690 [Pilimelia anulata]